MRSSLAFKRLLVVVALSLGAMVLLEGARPVSAQAPREQVSAPVETVERPAPSSLDDYEILQYVAVGRHTPGRAIALDNNGEILLACREGAMPSSLADAGITFKESQIEFLLAMDLLVRDRNGLLITTFPILDETQTRELRTATASIAATLVEELEAEIENLRQRLTAAGLEDHGYPIFFSYVLDGLVWSFFEEYRKVVPRRLSVRRPFWSGQVWAVRPSRTFAAATRSISHKGLTLKVTTSGGETRAIRALTGHRLQLRSALAEISTSGKVSGEELLSVVGKFGIVGPEGLWSVPVVDEIEKGPVYRAAEKLTEALVAAILDPERVDLEGLRSRYGFRSDPQTLVIVYHELIWDLMESLVASGVVTTPSILGGGDGGTPADVASVAFVVDRRPPKPDRRDPVEPKFDELPEGELPEPRDAAETEKVPDGPGRF